MREVQVLMVLGVLGACAGASAADTATTGAKNGAVDPFLGEWWKLKDGAADPPVAGSSATPLEAAQPAGQSAGEAPPAGPQPAVPPAPAIDQSSPPSAGPETAHFVHNRDSIPERPDVVFPFDGRLVLDTRAGIGSSPASVAVTRSALSGNLVFGPEHDLQISLPVDWELSTYSFRNASSIVPGGDDRFRNAEQLVFAPNIEGKINDQWGVFGGGLLIDAGQYGANDTMTYGGYGGVVWRPDKSLTLRLGAGARTQLDNYLSVFPAFWLEWKLGERTRLTSQGYNFRFEYDINKAWTIKFDAAYEQRVYRLDDDGPAAHGVLRDYEVPLTARLEFVPHAATRFELWVGADVYRELTVDLGKDQRFSRTHPSPSLICGVSFEIIF